MLLVVITIQIQASDKPEFLGTMAGEITYIKSNLNREKPTYARVYRGFGGSDSLRTMLTNEGSNYIGEGYVKIGKAYSYTPFKLYDRR